MSKLAEMIGGSKSSDIIVCCDQVPVKKHEAPRGEPASEVTATIDLSICERFSSAQSMARPKECIFSVNKRSELYMGEVVGASFRVGDRIACYLSPDGTHLTIKREMDGIPCRKAGGKKFPNRSSKVLSCSALVRALAKRGIAVTAHYDAVWNEQLQAWVGRLRQEGARRHG